MSVACPILSADEKMAVDRACFILAMSSDENSDMNVQAIGRKTRLHAAGASCTHRLHALSLKQDGIKHAHHPCGRPIVFVM